MSLSRKVIAMEKENKQSITLEEYQLQDILDNIITDEEQEKEENELIATISTDLKKQVSGKKKVPAKA